jgi:hypothetical protein
VFGQEEETRRGGRRKRRDSVREGNMIKGERERETEKDKK